MAMGVIMTVMVGVAAIVKIIRVPRRQGTTIYCFVAVVVTTVTAIPMIMIVTMIGPR